MLKHPIVKLQYARKTKIVQVDIAKANQNPIKYLTELGLKYLEFPEGTEKCHVKVETKFEKNMIEVTEDTRIMDVISIIHAAIIPNNLGLWHPKCTN